MKDSSLENAVVSKMFDHDAFSQWLGIERIAVKPGKVILRMEIKKEMLNGFDILHGGVTFSFADSALAFAANSHGRKSVALDASMSFTRSAKVGDILTATAEEAHLGNKVAVYNITIEDQNKEVIALFKGTVYRTSEKWDVTI
ncbi:MAG: hotdog fold thioesterase [Bacteroidia bacterium]|nr:hotdog fold thioesterase [Bacteroidia bacterium]